ncbi:MAG: hypothetical protein LBT25_02810 [Candidatus Symbiothrix sp.]|nr:hypothetical protein [Candidatus Symbiothrix sp.]
MNDNFFVGVIIDSQFFYLDAAPKLLHFKKVQITLTSPTVLLHGSNP